MKEVYIAKFDLLACCITAVGTTEDEARSAVIDAYVERRIQKYGEDPRTKYMGHGKTLFEMQVQAPFLTVKRMTIGEVEVIERED